MFRDATLLPLGEGLGRSSRLGALLASTATQPGRLAALIKLLRVTPVEVVHLSTADAGLALRRYFNEKFIGLIPQNRLCRGVLLLPSDHRAYLRGRRRQALRTNLRRAAAAGVWCQQVSDPSRASAATEEVLVARRRRPDDLEKLRAAWRELFALPEVSVFVACAVSGTTLAVVAAVIDTDVCLIRVAVASDHNARWALHDHLVRELLDRGVRRLLAEGGGPFGALGFDAELHHYQHLLGYELRHLVPSNS